eukprot:GHVS01018158.1.p1 GENE.GHVS01018158.1~~GHVS01018158.1.p1  ORF type:complete len:180 (-),score=13.52 GHVS01018158.1:931-1470(-)
MPRGTPGSAIKMAQCGSVWVFLVGITLGFLTLGINWAWTGVYVTESIVFGSLALCFYVPFSFCVSSGTNSQRSCILKIGSLWGLLSQIFSMVAFGYWTWWIVSGRGVYYVSGDRYVDRPDEVFGIAVSMDVFYFIAMCTFGSTISAAAKLADGAKFKNMNEECSNTPAASVAPDPIGRV